MDIKITKTTHPKQKPNWDELSFGTVFTDHMLMIDYMEGEGWKDARIIPYQDICLDPAACVFHYGVEVFEGMKAYNAPDGRILLFRPEANAKRLNSSGERLLIPELPVEMFMEGLKTLVSLDRDWIPKRPDQSLYIRPFTFATQPHLGVSRSNSYTFCIILSPVGAYYPEGLDPVKIFVEDDFARSVKGGTGYIKCGGNYAVSLLAGEKAEKKGYSQVLWLDSQERKYVEEVGAMNIFFKIDGKIYTAAALDKDGTVLPGVTRRSIIELLKDWGYEVKEEHVAIADIMEAGHNGKLEEVFGTGTAAVVSPVKELRWKGQVAHISGGQIGPMTQKLYDTLTGIQWGKLPDEKGWTVPVD